MNLTVSHYENFPVVSGIFGKGARKTLAAVYCFARYADDFADEPCYEGVRLRLLDEWEKQLEDCIEARPLKNPVFIALSEAVARHDLDAGPFLDLLSAFRQDCTKNRYGTKDEVLDYCSRSANPVGRIVLRVMKKDSPRAVELSDKTCTALQLINFWQDLSVDRKRDRLYVPAEIAIKHGVSLDSLIRGNPGKKFVPLLRDLVAMTAEMMAGACELPEVVGFPGEFYMSAVQRGGMNILESVGKMGEEILHRRPSLGKFDMGIIFMKSVGEIAGRKFCPPGFRLLGGRA